MQLERLKLKSSSLRREKRSQRFLSRTIWVEEKFFEKQYTEKQINRRIKRHE